MTTDLRDVCLGKLLSTTREPCPNCMLGVFFGCCPSQINDTVVYFVAVLVIHEWFVARVGYESASNKPMNFSA
ncbi:MAG: hypothetical protein WB523_13515 [Candidatus Sulfotelmatobacter sp.]